MSNTTRGGPHSVHGKVVIGERLKPGVSCEDWR